MQSLKLISWNVNGIRAIMKKGFLDFLKTENPDVIGLQEIKISPDLITFDIESINGYKAYFNSADKKGYAGTGIYSKVEPISIAKGVGEKKWDDEGRITTAEFEKFYFVTVYVPNSKDNLERLDYRQEWDKMFLGFLKELERKKPVIFCGDLNVAHQEIDLARPNDNVGKHGFTDEERAGFQKFIDAGFIDTFRHFHKEGQNYSWWSYFGGARARNVGWRIDYFLVSKSLEKNLKKAFILPEVRGSDHCPVGIEIEI